MSAHLNRSTPSSLPIIDEPPSIAPSKLKKLEGDRGGPASMNDCMVMQWRLLYECVYLVCIVYRCKDRSEGELPITNHSSQRLFAGSLRVQSR